MLTSSKRALCPLCEAHLLTSNLQRMHKLPTTYTAPWSSNLQARTLKTMQKRKETPRASRMLLSPRVASHAPAPSSARAPAIRRKSRNSPFGAMNRTDPGPSLRREMQERSAKTRNPIPTGTISQRKKGKVERKPGDMKALRMQRSLATVPYAHRTQVKAGINVEEVEKFDTFGLRDDVMKGLSEVLEDMTDVAATPIQRLALPAMLGFGDHKGRRRRTQPSKPSLKSTHQYLVAAETGSGKTLCYALPIIHNLKNLEESETAARAEATALKQSDPKRNLFEIDPPPLSSDEYAYVKPRALILLPSAELVTQVGTLFKSLAHNAKLRVAAISAAHSAKVIRSRLFDVNGKNNSGGVDVVISTPALLQSIAQSTPSILSDVKYLVIDEADSLFDRSFAPITSAIVDRCTPSLSSLILASATIPRALDGYLRARFPQITRLVAPNLHAVPRRVQLSVVDIEKQEYKGNRDLACADAIWRIGRLSNEGIDRTAGVKLIMVFVNEREQATKLSEYLRSQGIDAEPLSRDTGSVGNRSRSLIEQFTTRQRMDPTEAPGEYGPVVTSDGRSLTGVKVLVCTDIASRGLDTVAVRTVVLYDVPHSTVDFLHRLGRTGRMGRRGRGVVLVGDGDRRDVVREVREGMFMGRALV